MTYYKPRVPDWLPTALFVCAVLVVGVFAARQTLANAEARGRAAAYRDIESMQRVVWPAERAQWARERDSLRAVLVVRDSSAGVAIAEARRAIRAAQARPVRVDRVLSVDTVRDASVDTALRACVVALNDCDAVRETARALGDSAGVLKRLHAADSAAVVRATVTAVAARDTLTRERTKQTNKPGWRGVLIGTLAGLVSGALAVVGR